MKKESTAGQIYGKKAAPKKAATKKPSKKKFKLTKDTNIVQGAYLKPFK